MFSLCFCFNKRQDKKKIVAIEPEKLEAAISKAIALGPEVFAKELELQNQMKGNSNTVNCQILDENGNTVVFTGIYCDL